MKKLLLIPLIAILLASCASIPKETVILSQNLGKDIKALHESHRNMVVIHFGKLKDDINSYIDETYAPFVIHFVLKDELQCQTNGEPSIFTTLTIAGETGSQEKTEAAVKEMQDFINDAHEQIEKERKSLLSPVIKQETFITATINNAYENAIHANSAITAHLKSIQKVKETQQEAISMLGLKDVDTFTTKNMTKYSEQIKEIVEQGKKIDIKSDDAYKKLQKISEKIKKITHKK